MSTAALDPRAVSRILLSVTARSWGIEQGMQAQDTVVLANVQAPRRAARRLRPLRVAPTALHADGLDVTTDQWPYWPTYPGLAAHWR